MFLSVLRSHNIGLYYHQWYGGFQEQGVDFDIPAGTEVVALASGIVVGAGYYGGGGVVTIRTENTGDIYYQHLDSIQVATGTQISTGDTLGTSGGDCGWHTFGNPCPTYSSGEHLEIGINPIYCGLWGSCPHPGPSQDPLPWIESLGG